MRAPPVSARDLLSPPRNSDLLGWATLEEYYLKARFQALHKLSPGQYSDPDAPSTDFKVREQRRALRELPFPSLWKSVCPVHPVTESPSLTLSSLLLLCRP